MAGPTRHELINDIFLIAAKRFADALDNHELTEKIRSGKEGGFSSSDIYIDPQFGRLLLEFSILKLVDKK